MLKPSTTPTKERKKLATTAKSSSFHKAFLMSSVISLEPEKHWETIICPLTLRVQKPRGQRQTFVKTGFEIKPMKFKAP